MYKNEKGLEDILVELPIVDELENVKLPSIEMVTFWKNYQDRILSIDCPITENIIEYIKMIVRFNKEDKGVPIEDRKPIKIYCYSYGGDADIGNALIDCIEMSKTPVWVFNMGICASMMALISMAGHKRFAMPNAQYLIHQGMAGVQGQTSQVFDAVDNMKKNEDKIRDYVLSHTNIDKRLYNKKAKVEWYVNAEEALKLGICDEIVKDMDLLY